MTKKTNKLVVLDWFLNGEIGESSKTIARCACGIVEKDGAYPLDPDDFNRCLLLMNMLHDKKIVMKRLRMVSPFWSALVDRWSEIEAVFLEEVGLNWKKARSAPCTYALMKVVEDRVRSNI